MDFLSLLTAEELMESSDDEMYCQAFLSHAETCVTISIVSEVIDRKHGISRPGRQPNTNRSYLEGHQRLFAENPLYSKDQFRSLSTNVMQQCNWVCL